MVGEIWLSNEEQYPEIFGLKAGPDDELKWIGSDWMAGFVLVYTNGNWCGGLGDW